MTPEIELRIRKILSPREETEGRFIEDHNELTEVVKHLKAIGQRIVYTSGTWDIKHVGHERYLTAARKEGDILIVGCDIDELARKKGPNRPVVPMTERVAQLANLRSVHIITPVPSHKEAEKFIKKIKPEVLVFSQSTEKNKDGHVKEIKKMYDGYCEKVVILEPQATTSTTARVRTLMLHGIDEFKENVIRSIDQLHEQFKNGGKK